MEDLREFRAVVAHVCRRLDIDLVAMEDFTADPRSAAVLCKEQIAGSDVFLGLYAHRYGFKPPEHDGASITELEYRWARERVPPPELLAFLVDEKQPWPVEWIDHGTDRERLQDFKRELRLRHVVGRLTEPAQLRGDLLDRLREYSGARRSPAPPPEPALPRPPEPHVAHHYNLLHSAGVIGREAELAELDAWAGDAGGPRLLSIVGIGGLGKSALSWRWFHERVAVATPLVAGRLWWSFYHPDADLDRFITVALAYCSQQPMEAVRGLPAADRERRLLALLDREPFLLVLDGVEHLLGAFADRNFAHLRDEDVERLTAGGPTSERLRLRGTADVRAGEFLLRLATLGRTRTLLTTRVQPAVLETDSGDDAPGCRRWDLPNMRFDDASALWRAMRCSGTPQQLHELFEQIGYYPLLIRILAGKVRRFRPAPGHLDSFMRDNPDLDPFGLPLVRSKNHVLAGALEGLSSRSHRLLSAIATFRSAIHWTTLDELFIERIGWTLAELDAELEGLEDRGILAWDRELNTYDVHAVVRGVMWTGVGAPAPEATESPDLAREADVHLMSLLQRQGDHTTAVRLYTSRLGGSTLTLTGLGLVDTEITLLEGFFPQGTSAEPAVDDQDAQAVLAWLGSAYEAAGRLPEALDCGQRCVGRLGDQDVQGFLFGYLSERLRMLGRLEEALDAAGRTGRADDPQLALCLATIGRHEEAGRILARRRASSAPPERADVQAHLLIGAHAEAVDVGTRFLRGRDLWVVDRLIASSDILEARFRKGDDDIDQAFEEILAEARDKKLAEPELHCLRLLAEIRRVRAEDDRAFDALRRFDQHSAAGHYRLIGADVANIRAGLPQLTPQARAASAHTALDLARCAGPPFTYQRALDAALASLRDLGLGPAGGPA
jgi:tetratricopeptide (TPR) repeat protein